MTTPIVALFYFNFPHSIICKLFEKLFSLSVIYEKYQKKPQQLNQLLEREIKQNAI
jgi:hypothetical protein